jgi:MFS family permease
LGGIIGIPIVGYFSGLHAWNTAFFIGVGFAIVSALAWLGIRVDEMVQEPAPAVPHEQPAVG